MLRRLYSSLLRCRLLQERIRALSASCAVAARYQVAVGHEAVTVGATFDLGADDSIVAAARNLPALLSRGAPLKTLLCEHASPACACSFMRAQAPEDPFNLGTGIALAHRLERRRHVVVAFCAQETPPLEDWHNALKFAAVHKLPILYVVKNGIAAGPALPGEAPHLESLSFLTRDYGFPGILVDGGDVVAVWRVAQESVHRARMGSGPTLIDCRTDSSRDPLAHMEHYLRQRKAWNDRWRKQVEQEISAEIEEATEAVLSQ